MTTSERIDAIMLSDALTLMYEEEVLRRMKDELPANQYYMFCSHIVSRKAQLATLSEIARLLKEARSVEEKTHVQEIAQQFYNNGRLGEHDIKTLSMKLMEEV